MTVVTPESDSTVRLDRYYRRLVIGWTLIVTISLGWNLVQHITDFVNVKSDIPAIIEIGGHSLMWLFGLVMLRFGTKRFRAQLTARHQIEEELRKLSRAVEQSSVSIIITDLQGQIEYVNPKFTQVTGYQPEEVIGQNPRLLKSGEMSGDQYRHMWETILAGRDWSGEFHNRRKNGELFWESAFISAVKNPQGVVTHLLAVKEDITERKRSEQAEQEQRNLAESLRNIAADLNSTLEFDTVLDRILENVGRVVPHDEANIMLISGDTAYVCLSRGAPPYPILTVRLSVAQTAHLQQMVETGQPIVISDVTELDNWAHHPESDWIRSYISAPIRVKGETLGFINLDSATPGFFNAQHAARLAIFADQAATAVENARLYQQAQTELHERRKVEAELQHAKEAAEAASQAKSIFLANMSHELRTPLNAILGFAQLISRDSNLTTDQLDDLNIVVQSGQHLLTLINDVLDMSKIEAGRLTLQLDNFDLLRLLNTVEEMFRLRAADKHLALSFELDPALPRYLHADEGKLRQVLINLLGNAVKYTPTGSITLRARYTDEQLVIEVEDTGPGMTSDEMEIVFEPFVQAASNQRPQEGTGLGLSISRQFIRLMGGELTATSVPGRGSIFAVRVPVDVVAAATVPSAPITRRVVKLEDGQPAYRLLVVDDRDVSRRLLVKLLEPLGFQVREAADGREALDVWEHWQPHLIWMDMRMPIMDGHEATRRIKATPQGQATIIVALTASAFQDDRAVILADGCDDFVRKPYRDDEIFDRLVRHLGVRFVYETESLVEQAESSSLGEHAEVAPLPIGWLNDLQQATIQADLDRMLGLIEQVRPSHMALAAQLADWANQFNYEQITHFIQHAGEQPV
ncbi:MAG: ATP-binding protein [Anaerolineae bacterium]